MNQKYSGFAQKQVQSMHAARPTATYSIPNVNVHRVQNAGFNRQYTNIRAPSRYLKVHRGLAPQNYRHNLL